MKKFDPVEVKQISIRKGWQIPLSLMEQSYIRKQNELEAMEEMNNPLYAKAKRKIYYLEEELEDMKRDNLYLRITLGALGSMIILFSIIYFVKSII